ncbi:MAG: hypothetical protein Tsb0016_04640 [Sphingomonadales bacterium]
MARMIPFKKGVHEIGRSVYAYLQPDGSWGWNNTGLIIDGDESLLVDTLFDERLTAEMLAAMAASTGLAASDIGVLVNTHANGDHTFGNRLVERAEIIASAAGAAEMDEVPPQMLAELMRQAPHLGQLGDYLLEIFAPFDFAGVRFKAPTKTFSGAMSLHVGAKKVDLIEVGPAHTKGDVIVHVPDDKVVYTGDILFIDGTPIMWAGPVANWIAACDRIIALDAEIIVPGHGPVTDKTGVRQVQDYLRYIDAEARKRYDAGLSVEQAAHDIALGDYAAWGDAERIAVNIDTLYREYSGDDSHPDIMKLFTLMAAIRR